jgi:hypothetical protein
LESGKLIIYLEAPPKNNYLGAVDSATNKTKTAPTYKNINW